MEAFIGKIMGHLGEMMGKSHVLTHAAHACTLAGEIIELGGDRLVNLLPQKLMEVVHHLLAPLGMSSC